MIECEENGYYGMSVKKENVRQVSEEFFYLFSGTPRLSKKTTCASRLARSYYNAGYKVIVFTDVKDTLDYAHCQFLPQESWHLKKLKEQGEEPKTILCEVLHPFCFNIPKKKIPETKFYTLSLKTIDESDIGFLGGFKGEVSTNIILSNVHKLSNKEGFYSFIHKVNESIKEYSKGVGNKKIYKFDENNFLSQTSSLGDRGNIKEVTSMFKIFGEKYDEVPLFMENDFELNLNWDSILNCQEKYTVFSTRYIPRNKKKLKKFFVFKLLKDFYNNFNEYAKYPVLIIIEEIRNFMPSKPVGYDKIMEQELRNMISSIGGQGKGISIITTTQVYTDVSSEVMDSFNQRWIGNMAGAVNDFKRLSMSLGWGTDKRENVQNLRSGEWVKLGNEDSLAFKSQPPEHALQSRFYKYDELYKKYYPEQMNDYKDLKDMINKKIKEERDMIRNKIKNKIVKQEQVLKKQELLKLNKKEQEEELRKMKEQKTIDKQELIYKRDKKIIEIINKSGKISSREIARIVKDELGIEGLSHPTVALTKTIWEKVVDDPEATISTIIADVQKDKKGNSNFQNYKQVENIKEFYKEFYGFGEKDNTT